jgi:hypothetical protein
LVDDYQIEPRTSVRGRTNRRGILHLESSLSMMMNSITCIVMVMDIKVQSIEIMQFKFNGVIFVLLMAMTQTSLAVEEGRRSR